MDFIATIIGFGIVVYSIYSAISFFLYLLIGELMEDK